MLLQILHILPIVMVCVSGHAPGHEPKHAVSTQSFHRDDVPLSYKYTLVHYTTPYPEPTQAKQPNLQENSKHKYIQYAPLQQNTYENDKHRYKHIPEQYEYTTQVLQQFQHSTEENERNHLEPRILAENLNVHDQSIRSYVPGHNVEVLQSHHVLENSDRYRAYHNILQNNLQKPNVNVPKLVIQQKPEQLIHHPLENFRAAEQRPLSEEHNILYAFLPRPVLNSQHNLYPVEKPYILHQTPSAKIPRLHLNIARVYGITHLPQQTLPVHITRPSIENPPTHTQAIFLPLKPPYQQKTILYPVQDTNKNYPIHT